MQVGGPTSEKPATSTLKHSQEAAKNIITSARIDATKGNINVDHEFITL